MTLDEFVRAVDGFDKLGPTEKIRLFAWYLQRHRAAERFSPAAVLKCFDEIHEHTPTNGSTLVSQLVDKDFIKDARGLRLAKPLADKLDAKYGEREQTIAVHKLLSELPAKLLSAAESEYLEEALKCFRVKAFRAAIVMTWNVAYDHLLSVILSKHLQTFNTACGDPNVLGGKKKPVSSRDDFQKWKESEVLDVCKLSQPPILSKEIHKVMQDSLDKRNSAAHPSGTRFDQMMAEAYITHVINNAALRL